MITMMWRFGLMEYIEMDETDTDEVRVASEEMFVLW